MTTIREHLRDILTAAGISLGLALIYVTICGMIG